MTKKVKAALQAKGVEPLARTLAPGGFQPGQSGNTLGRPSNDKTIMARALYKALAGLDDVTKKSRAEALTEGVTKYYVKQVNDGIVTRDTLTFMHLSFDRTEGKPDQKVTIDGSITAAKASRFEEILDRAIAEAEKERASTIQ